MIEVNLFRRLYQNPKDSIQEVIYAKNPFKIWDPGLRDKHFRKTKKEIREIVGISEAEATARQIESTARSIRRTKKEMKFLVLNNATNSWRFLTLTYRGEGQRDRNELYRDIEEFFEKARASTPRPIHYIAITEFHKDKKRMHCHILCDLPYMRNEEIEEKYWKHGFVKMEKLKAKRTGENLTAVLKYMMKYMSKDIEENVKKKKRYSSSRNMNREVIKVNNKISGEKEFNEMLADLLREGWKVEHSYKVETKDNEITGVLLSASPFE